MFLPSVSIRGHYPSVRVDIPFKPLENSVGTTAQKIKDVVALAFIAIASLAYDFFRKLTRTYKVAKLPVEGGAYKLSYKLPMLDKVSPKAVNQTPYVILALDGGGVRGKASLAALKQIEKEINGSLIDAVDCIAGVSTGGIIAAALSVPSEEDSQKPRYDAEGVDKLYDIFAQKVFANSTLHKIKSLWGAIASKYPSPSEIIKTLIGEVKLKDALAKKLLITSVDLLNSKLVLFGNQADDNASLLKNKNIDCISISPDATFCEAVEATSAAPTYFPTVEFREHNLTDGGISANNPAQIATLLALNEVAKGRPILVISIGTGKLPTEPITTKESIRWGWLQWVSPLIDYFLDSKATQADMEMELMAENNPLINYVRFQMILENASEAEMDNASPENLKRLDELGTRCFQHFLDQGGRESVIAPLKQKLKLTAIIR